MIDYSFPRKTDETCSKLKRLRSEVFKFMYEYEKNYFYFRHTIACSFIIIDRIKFSGDVW